MADAAFLHIRCPKSMFFFMRLVEEGSNSKEKMQTALFFMFAKKEKS